jgi:membrane protease YdiL (CAAX protease family)
VPFKKHPPEDKQTPPDTVILGRVAYPSGPKDLATASPPGEVAQPPVRVSPGALPSEPPPHALRRSLFNQVERQPQNPTPLILLGWSAADARSAAIYFQRALTLDPSNPVARDGLDWALSELSPADAALILAPAPPAEADTLGITQPAVRAPAIVPVRTPRWRDRDFRWRTLSRFYYIPFFRNLAIAIIYLLLISTAEIVTVLVDPAAGIIFHATIMIGLIIHGSILQQGPFRRYLIILALAPLIRLLSLSLPLAMFDIPIMYRYVIVGVPLFLAVYFSARSVGLTANRLYFTWKGWPSQLLFSLIGLILGVCEYFILHPPALVPSASWFNIAMGVFILFVFTGFLEELIFRSLLQVTGVQLFGGTAIWIISILFGILHIGYFSTFDVVFAASVGLFFGYFALKTRSILGVSLAHGITNVTLYIILPLVLH